MDSNFILFIFFPRCLSQNCITRIHICWDAANLTGHLQWDQELNFPTKRECLLASLPSEYGEGKTEATEMLRGFTCAPGQTLSCDFQPQSASMKENSLRCGALHW